MKKAVFLDRDGVINKAIVKNGLPTSPSLLDELKILPGVKESILKLKKLGFKPKNNLNMGLKKTFDWYSKDIKGEL